MHLCAIGTIPFWPQFHITNFEAPIQPVIDDHDNHLVKTRRQKGLIRSGGIDLHRNWPSEWNTRMACSKRLVRASHSWPMHGTSWHVAAGIVVQQTSLPPNKQTVRIVLHPSHPRSSVPGGPTGVWCAPWTCTGPLFFYLRLLFLPRILSGVDPRNLASTS